MLRAGTGLLLAASGARLASGTAADPRSGKLSRLAMLIDLRKCYGCRTCAVACKSENGVPLGNFRSWVGQVVRGGYPAVRRRFIPRLCNHCRRPACARVCPTGASRSLPNGVVAIDKDLCIGCRYCMSACPYGVRSFVWNRPKAGEPEYPSRVFGVVDKCDFCLHRITAGIRPACVESCPSGARVWGDLNDPSSEIRRLAGAYPVQTLLPELGTGPMILYIGLDEEAARVAVESGVRTEPVESNDGSSGRGGDA